MCSSDVFTQRRFKETIGVASIKAVNQYFLEVTKEDEAIQRGQAGTWDGLVGLALNQFTGGERFI